MSRGRHSLPAAPRSEGPLLAIGLVIVAVALGTIWWVDDSLTVQVAATALVVIVTLGAYLSMRASRRTTAALWQDAMERRRELLDVQHHLSDLRAQNVELLLELRTLRSELLTATEDAARNFRAATDQQALMRDLLAPRPAAPEPVYPSMHLPLVRAAFSDVLPGRPPVDIPTPGPSDASFADSDESSGSEPFPPRQLLDLTASEIARLRPAN